MPLAQPISSLRQELNKLLANDDLPAGLKLCKELLPEGGEKHKLILAMQAQLKQLNNDRMKGLISQEEYARRIAIIVDSFINFVAELETADFDPPASAASKSPANSPKTGSVLYRVPHSMPLQKASICTIRVAIDEDAILEDIIIDADIRLKEKVEVSERMSAELLDTEGRVFDILPLNAKDQKVRPTGYTQWLFRVTPLVEGEHQLLVKVSLLEFDQNTKEYVPRDVSVLETVTVVTASQHSDEEEEGALKSAGESFVIGTGINKTFDKSSLQEVVNDSIVKGKTGEAIDAIIEWANKNGPSQLKNDAVIIKSGLETLKRQEYLGMLSFSEVARESAKINNNLMNLLKTDLTHSIAESVANSSRPNDKMKILAMAANPAQTAMDLYEEFEKIENLDGKQERFELVVTKAVNRDDFRKFTEIERPNILHFSGLGITGSHGGIVLQNKGRDATVIVPAAEIDALFKYLVYHEEFDLKAVVLNACFSEEQAEVIAKYVPFVIGTVNNIKDTDAAAFSVGFYFCLIDKGIDFENAFKAGRAQAIISGALEEDFILYKNGSRVY